MAGQQERQGVWTTLAQKRLFHLLYVSAGASEREVAMQNRLGVSPLCFAALSPPLSQCGIITVVVPNQSTLQ